MEGNIKAGKRVRWQVTKDGLSGSILESTMGVGVGHAFTHLSNPQSFRAGRSQFVAWNLESGDIDIMTKRLKD